MKKFTLCNTKYICGSKRTTSNISQKATSNAPSGTKDDCLSTSILVVAILEFSIYLVLRFLFVRSSGLGRRILYHLSGNVHIKFLDVSKFLKILKFLHRISSIKLNNKQSDNKLNQTNNSH